jgi:hypothetical protein
MGGNRVSERDATTFGQWLRRRRKGLGLTQAELARKVGCATITDPENRSGRSQAVTRHGAVACGGL